jgi:DNA mismatch repair protein MutL
MARIQPLPPTLVNQIAAGEVVERPASVVKELLENAIDAGSTRIDIEVRHGGSDLIQIVDNGCGIHADDLPLAFASHATSKLRDVDDLFRIDTLGFRGEALASLGSIAQVTLQSRTADQPSGAAITCHGGQLSPVGPWNGTPGTRLEVRHLFYNTPARRKFLKSVATEMGHVSEAFTRVALAQLSVHLTLRHNGKLLYEVPASMGLLDRIGLFFGPEVQNALYLIEAQAGLVAVGGYVADPSCERGNSQLQYLFLNGRWVRDRGLFQAVQDAYRGLLMTGRYPVAFLFLEVPSEQVDVNVHPTKAEVRFHDKDRLYALIQQAVRERLRVADLTAQLQLKTRPEEATVAQADLRSPGPLAAKGVPASPVREEVLLPTGPREMPSAARSTAPAREPSAPAREPSASNGSLAASPMVSTELFAPAASPTRETAGQRPPECRTAEAGAPAATGMVRALQVLDCYLVVEVPPDEVLFIDQHALHERILFEQLQQRLHSGRLERQRLLIPETVELPARQAALVLEECAALAELGLDVADFGGGTLVLNSYPALLGRHCPKDVLRAVVDYLLSKERVPSREQLLHDLLSLMACHAAVRAGDRLTEEAIAALLAQRELAQNSHHCPHGRPTALRFSRRDLERHFKRV